MTTRQFILPLAHELVVDRPPARPCSCTQVKGYHQLPDGRWKKNPTGTEYEPKPVQIWYMRDNHTFRTLPLDVDGALAAMREERDAGNTYGMLCGSPHGVVPGSVHAGTAAKWPEFEVAARKWLELAVACSKPPNAKVTGAPLLARPS